MKMKRENIIEQPNLFESNGASETIENILLYALGEFQSRGKVLANRELALDRLRGAFKRASEKFGTEEFSDEEIAKGLEKIGANVKQVPSFVAKHPFRVTVNSAVSNRAVESFKAENAREKVL